MKPECKELTKNYSKNKALESFSYDFTPGKCSTAILASSDKKEQAFKLIVILRTKPEYGNLLIYGVEAPENAGYLRSGSENKWVFEIDDGLIQDEEGELHISSFEERNDYYNNHVTASPTLYRYFPPEYIELIVTF